MQLQYDVGKWCSECSYTSDDGLLGLRALYNFGQPTSTGQWSVGTELYYGTLDKSGGSKVMYDFLINKRINLETFI